MAKFQTGGNPFRGAAVKRFSAPAFDSNYRFPNFQPSGYSVIIQAIPDPFGYHLADVQRAPGLRLLRFLLKLWLSCWR